MDIKIFSPKSETLSLTTCNPPPLTWLYPSTLQSIRRDLLLWPQNHRAPPRNCKKLGLLHTRSTQFLVKASFNPPPDSLLIADVVALVSFTAVSVACLNHFLRNPNKNSKQLSGSENHPSSQLSSDIVDCNFENQITDHVDLFQGSSSGGNENLMEIESNQVSDEKTAQKTNLVHRGPHLTETSSPSFGVDSFVSRQQECLPILLSESGIVQPLIFATELSELQLGKVKKETISDIKLPGAIVNVKSCDSLVLQNYAHAEVSELTGNGVLTEVIGEEQYVYLRANQSVLKSPANLEVVKAISSQASPLNSYSLFSLKKDTELEGADLSIQEALQTSEHGDRKILVTYHKEGPSHQSIVKRRGRSFSRDKECLVPDNSKNILPFPYTNGKQDNDTYDVSELYRSYNRLIRKERLADCVDLLENMERKGFLDMNQVYHTRFFNVCKNQKAIKEAFRFFKLVPNPTLSTFNMLMSVCASSKDSEGAFRVLQLVREAGLKADCKLYTTLITTCAKSGEIDAIFEVFHEMVNAGVEPNVHTYGALIDGCAKVGQVAKAFGAYGIMRSKNVKPDRVVFNALITACGQSGAVDRAFDVLAEMNAEVHPIDPDHITIGALIKACANAGQVDRAREVYKMIHKYNIKGTPDVYTIAINCCSQTGDWEFACSVYDDMTKKGVVPDEVFLSALIDFAGHAGKVEAAFEILQEAKNQGIRVGTIAYSSLMGACSNAKNWQKALELYEHMKSIKLKPTVSTMNALITSLCDGEQLPKAMEVLSDMKRLQLLPNTITYSILLVASERMDNVEVGLMLLSQAKEDGVTPSLIMFKCIIGMCSRRYEKARTLGEHVLCFKSGRPHIENKWTSLALMVYREAIVAGVLPTMEVVSQVLGCLQLPYNDDIRDRLVDNLGVSADSVRRSNLCSLIDGFGEYDPCAFSLLEEAASLGIVPCVSFKESPIVVDATKLKNHIAKVYILTVLKGLKHRLAAGAKLPTLTILLPVEKMQIMSVGEMKTISLAERTSQAVAALLRRLGLAYQGNESFGKIRINGLSLKRWFQPKLATPFSGKPGELSSFQLGKVITHQQRNIRTGNLSLE